MRDVLRADNHNGTVERDDVHELLLEIGGPRWKVEQEDVELSPLHLMDELPQRGSQERRSQRQCLPLSQQKSDRHDPNPVRVDGLMANVATTPEVPPAGVFMPRQVDHEGDVGPIHVGIQKSDRQAATRERKG